MATFEDILDHCPRQEVPKFTVFISLWYSYSCHHKYLTNCKVLSFTVQIY
jgi:hypothetical protein